MCTRKKELRNPVTPEHETGFDKLYLRVPCGKCPECRQRKSNDWVFRSYFEFLKEDKQAFFVTLTYDDDHLPHYNDKPCFDFRHIQTFFSRIRHVVGQFRYFVSSEYGGFLHRPHYHIVFLPSRCISAEELQKAVHDYWEYGYIYKIDSLVSVNGSRLKAITYISQYVSKDLDFDSYAYEFDMPSYCRQKLLASKGYGANCDLTDEDFKRGYMFLPLGKDGISVRFSIPRYYELRRCYDYHWDRVNQKVEMKKNQFGYELSVDRHNRHYKHLLSVLYSSRTLNLDYYFGVDYPFHEKWFDVVKDCFSDRDSLLEFSYLRPFLLLSEQSSYDFLNGVFVSGYKARRFAYLSRVFAVLEKYQSIMEKIKDCILVDRQVVQQRKRMYHKLQNDHRLLRYLHYRKFDFSNISLT